MTDILNIKEKTKRATVGIPKGMKKAVSISIAFSVNVLIRNETIISQQRKTKKPFEIILHKE